MSKRSSQDNILMRPLPSPRVPWLVILFLIGGIVLIYMGFLRPKEKLLGPPVREPEYTRYVIKAKKPVRRQNPPAATTPAQTTPAPAQTTAPATTAPAQGSGQ
jgi:hypothetical protein